LNITVHTGTLPLREVNIVVQNFDLLDITHTALKGRIGKRLANVSGRAALRTWALEEFSRGWSDEDETALKSILNRFTSRATLECNHAIADVEQIRAYLYQPVPRFQEGGRKRQKWQIDSLRTPDLGMAIAVNVPILCTGCGYHDDMHDEFFRRSLVGEGKPPPYVRLGAHGPTFGTVLAKVVRKRFVEGTFRGPAVIKLAVCCNNCLDTFVGKLSEKNDRETNNLPKLWISEQNERVDKLIKQENNHASLAGNLSRPVSTKKASKQNRKPQASRKPKPKPTAEKGYSTMTVVEMRTLLRERGKTVSGVKSELEARLRYG